MALKGRQDFENMLCWLPKYDTNYYGIPDLKGCFELPEDAYFTNSEFARRNKDYNSWVMFYEYDYKFMKMWEQPKRQAKWLSNFRGAITPNFSVYQDIPYAMALWSVYRARWCGAFWESIGIQVIPDVSWGNKSTYEFAFEGIPKHSIVAVNDIGNHKKENQESRNLWLCGYEKMLEELRPKTVLLYGSKAKDIPNDSPIIYISSLDCRGNK